MSALVLASGSEIRAELLRRAGVEFVTDVARIDESSIRESLLASGAPPRDIADALAEAKALRVSARQPGRLVIGADQVLEADGVLHAKPDTQQAAVDQITQLLGKTHELHSAVVLARDGIPQWRHVETVRLTMAQRSAAWVTDYVARNWGSVQHSVGGYKLEEEGIRLFSRVEGDYFATLGLPLLPLLNHLTLRGELAS